MRYEVGVFFALIVVLAGCRAGTTTQSPLTDKEFWSLSTQLSEPTGTFTHSENLVSNETDFVHIVQRLQSTGGAYIGVGPEQNFSYIARLKPELAFIVDIRRENRDLHLLYKALFEMSPDRPEFLSRLFSRKRPADVDAHTPVQDLFSKYATADRDDALRDDTRKSVHQRLIETHGFEIPDEDLKSIDYVLDAFYSDGTNIHYAGSRVGSAAGPSYRLLMTATDFWGETRSYLGSEEAFAFVKQLQERNLIIPVVGDFAGSKAIRGVGDYLRSRGEKVRAFYGSNVEVYLNREQEVVFCANLAALPHDFQTYFIGNKNMRLMSAKLRACRSNQP
jgi:hypothetical protein